MTTFDKKDLQRFAVSTVGAVVLSAACVVAAVGPARGAVPSHGHSAKAECNTILVAAK